MTLTAIKDIADIIADIITALAAIVAGAFAYYRFVKGRVFHPRLTLSAQARQFRIGAADYLLTTIEASNVGQSRIDLSDATLRVCSLEGHAGIGTVSEPQRGPVYTSRVLLAESWIESGKPLREQSLLTLPSGHDAPVLINLRVVAQGVSFTATAIAEPVQSKGGQRA
ncbi:hypothetical protein F0U60_18310 [Archangium minus]|uniref:Uncharacterized protein n=1 Tax=Archangium minus TaxID=83450 RepID=A0ABY9WQC4_9BACT|nr:hypothetical protein F0U60_18310 [Archangium minus]